jgi:hypothetical protein
MSEAGTETIVSIKELVPEPELQDYAEDILQYNKTKETQELLSPYMAKQHDINAKMRRILVDWLTEVLDKWNLSWKVLFYAVKYTDQFLSVKQIVRQKLQLVGLTALWMGSKIEHRLNHPEVRDASNIADKTYQKDDFIKMEKFIGSTLGWKLMPVTTHDFLEFGIRVATKSMPEMTSEFARLALYLGVLSLHDYEISVNYPPSHVASACILLAIYDLTGQLTWNTSLRFYMQYTVQDLEKCVSQLWELQDQKRNPDLPGARRIFRKGVLHPVSSAKYFRDLKPEFVSASVGPPTQQDENAINKT